MIRRILKSIGIGSVAMASSCSHPQDRPYKDEITAFIYDLLFCDRLELFKQNHKGPLVPPWSILFADKPDLDAVAVISTDKAQEARIRMLAFNLLRAEHCKVEQKELLATIIEVGLPHGLDTLAVFAEGGTRYINHSGKMVIVEGKPNPFEAEIKQVLAASQPIVAAIGPWDKERLTPPKNGMIRMTFLVSDGLYFGQGPMEAMQKEKMAAPLINAATDLLVKLVQRTTDGEPQGGRHSPPAARSAPPTPLTFARQNYGIT